jgi:Rad3-related DNA helicase
VKIRAEKASDQALRQRQAEAQQWEHGSDERRILQRTSEVFLTRLRKQEEDKQMTEPLGDAPIEAEYKEKMNRLARAIDQLFNGEKHGNDREVGFVLLVFPFGDKEGGRTNYISNGADRKDIVALFKEQIKRFEGQPDLTGHV